MSGLTPTGYVATTTQEEVDDLNAKFLANVDGALDLAPDQPIGQIVGTFAEKFAQLTELGATVYNMLNPAAAEGQFLVNTSAISGTVPQVATFSTVTASLTLAAGTTVHAGAIAAVLNQPTNTWVLTADVTNSGGTTAVFPGIFRSSLPGPFVANAGTLTVIGSPTTGWISVTSAADAAKGLAADTDTTLRQKREAELNGQGAGNVDAIRAAVLKVPGVIQAFVFENTTLTPGLDANGVPPKSFRVIVWDGPSPLASNTAIAQTIWNHKSSGSASYGATLAEATDSIGALRDVFFDRAVQQRLWVVCTTTPGTLSSDGTQAVKDSLKAYADATFNLGVSIIAVPFRCEAVVPGVTTDVPVFQFDFHSSPTNTGNLVVPVYALATLSTTDITVN